MGMFHATTTIDIYRGEDTDDYGDSVDTDRPVYTGIVASIIEQNKTVRNQNTRQPEVIRSYTGRVYAGTDIQDEDRIRDRKTNQTYIVDGISQPANPAAVADINLDLRRVT